MDGSLLQLIDSPKDLKQMDLSDLKLLADEIRQKIIEVLSVNGGHLSSNLGIVEITIALHKVFNSPIDKFIFDTSHQTYPHKLLTGRKERFTRIRKFKGLCGFADPKESPHDHFYAGHAATAFSLALGVAKNRDLSNKEEHVIPILGDASLTCGLTLEALNNIPEDLKSFIIVLNDNEMSISNSVGNIKNILSRLLSNPLSNKMYHEIQDLLLKIPAYGKLLASQGKKITSSIKNLVSPATFFEQFGLSYIGPIDGHDIKKLVDTFSALKNISNPVIVHTMTVKGKGMPIAIENPTPYHGVKPFDLTSGKFIVGKQKPSFPKIFDNHIFELAKNDPDIVAITPAMPQASLNQFFAQIPERCIDVGIAEGHCVTFAGGLAYGKNKKVVACVYATFLQRALDNLFHDVCLQENPVIFALDRAGLSAEDGPTHHGIYDIGFLKAMPNMIITQPRDGHLLKELLQSAFTYKQPTTIRYPNMATEEDSKPLKYRPIGKGEILSYGKDLLIISLGHMFQTALEIKNLLVEKNVNPTILDPIFIKPLDSELLLELLSTHSYVVTIEEHSRASGLGSILNSFILQNSFNNIKVLNFGVPETFVQFGSYQELMKEIGLDSSSITKKILDEFNLCPNLQQELIEK